MSLTEDRIVDDRELVEMLRVLVDEAEERKQMRDSVSELLGDMTPLAAQSLESVSQLMTVADERGYLEFGRGGAAIVDRVVTSFDQDDLQALGDNIVLILETVREMTQPELMGLMRNTLHDIGDQELPDEAPSLLALMKRLRSTEARMGLHRLVRLLETLGSAEEQANNLKGTRT